MALLDESGVEALVTLALAAVDRGDPAGPGPLSLLLHEYASGRRPDIEDAIGLGLARALDEDASTVPDGEAAEWLGLFADAAALSGDDRIGRALVRLADRVRGAWPGDGDVSRAMKDVESCVRAAPWIAGERPDLLASAVDEMERVVGLGYTPGAGMRGAVPGAGAGGVGHHVATASALLAAFAVTGRLPYAMLAEDLMRFARRSWWDEADGAFGTTPADRPALAWFVENSEAACVLCRLAALHADAGYVEAAVAAGGSDPAADAARILARLARSAGRHGLAGAAYGVAVMELGRLSGDC